jgi:GNAT superfamily N-acetyltransferase
MGHCAGVRVYTVQGRDWRDYREIRLVALKDAPSAFASTWQAEALFTEARWRGRAHCSQDGEAGTIVVALDDTERWVGLAGGYRPGERGADAELISMWVAPESRGGGVGMELLCVMVGWGGRTVTGPALSVCGSTRPASMPSACINEGASSPPARLTSFLPTLTSRRSVCCSAPAGNVH